MRNHSLARHGVALIMVLVVVVLLSLGAYAFSDLMLAQHSSTVMSGRRIQARAAVDAGVEYIKDYLALTADEQLTLGGHYDNAAYFQDVIVAQETDGTVRFSIISIVEDDYGQPMGIRFGLLDEGSRININQIVASDQSPGGDTPSGGDSGAGGVQGGGDPTGGSDPSGGGSGGGAGGAGGAPGGSDPTGAAPTAASDLDAGSTDDSDPQRDALMVLPGMTEDIADSILDWIDEDDELRPLGAEATEYAFLGYQPKNGPIDSLDELLLVQGVTPELLYGADRNHNGVIDDSEQEFAAAMAIGTTAPMVRGWSAFLTVNSKDMPQQVEPIDLNQDDLEALFDELSAVFDADTAMFIAAYRQSGAYTPPAPDEGGRGEEEELPAPEDVGGREVDLTQEGGNKFGSVLDLIGAQTMARFEGSDEPVLVASPFTDDTSSMAGYLPDLMGNLTTGDQSGTGRINIDQACQAVLTSVPPMTDALVLSILGQRDPTGMSTDPNYLYSTWPLAFGLATLDEMKALMPFVSVSGGIYRAQLVGYSELPGAFARAEVVIDATGETPRVVSWRDLTHLGPGFPLDTLIKQQ